MIPNQIPRVFHPLIKMCVVIGPVFLLDIALYPISATLATSVTAQFLSWSPRAVALLTHHQRWGNDPLDRFTVLGIVSAETLIAKQRREF